MSHTSAKAIAEPCVRLLRPATHLTIDQRPQPSHGTSRFARSGNGRSETRGFHIVEPTRS